MSPKSCITLERTSKNDPTSDLQYSAIEAQKASRSSQKKKGHSSLRLKRDLFENDFVGGARGYSIKPLKIVLEDILKLAKYARLRRFPHNSLALTDTVAKKKECKVLVDKGSSSSSMQMKSDGNDPPEDRSKIVFSDEECPKTIPFPEAATQYLTPGKSILVPETPGAQKKTQYEVCKETDDCSKVVNVTERCPNVCIQECPLDLSVRSNAVEETTRSQQLDSKRKEPFEEPPVMTYGQEFNMLSKNLPLSKGEKHVLLDRFLAAMDSNSPNISESSVCQGFASQENLLQNYMGFAELTTSQLEAEHPSIDDCAVDSVAFDFKVDIIENLPALQENSISSSGRLWHTPEVTVKGSEALCDSSIHNAASDRELHVQSVSAGGDSDNFTSEHDEFSVGKFEKEAFSDLHCEIYGKPISADVFNVDSVNFCNNNKGEYSDMLWKTENNLQMKSEDMLGETSNVQEFEQYSGDGNKKPESFNHSAESCISPSWHTVCSSEAVKGIKQETPRERDAQLVFKNEYNASTLGIKNVVDIIKEPLSISQRLVNQFVEAGSDFNDEIRLRHRIDSLVMNKLLALCLSEGMQSSCDEKNLSIDNKLSDAGKNSRLIPPPALEDNTPKKDELVSEEISDLVDTTPIDQDIAVYAPNEALSTDWRNLRVANMFSSEKLFNSRKVHLLHASQEDINKLKVSIIFVLL